MSSWLHHEDTGKTHYASSLCLPREVKLKPRSKQNVYGLRWESKPTWSQKRPKRRFKAEMKPNFLSRVPWTHPTMLSRAWIFSDDPLFLSSYLGGKSVATNVFKYIPPSAVPYMPSRMTVCLQCALVAGSPHLCGFRCRTRSELAYVSTSFFIFMTIYDFEVAFSSIFRCQAKQGAQKMAWNSSLA